MMTKTHAFKYQLVYQPQFDFSGIISFITYRISLEKSAGYAHNNAVKSLHGVTEQDSCTLEEHN